MTFSVFRGRPSLFVEMALAVALVAAAVAYQFPGLISTPYYYDEGIMVYGASRIIDGQIPYRDFWTVYPPGQFYVLALLFSIFGPSLMVERLYDIIVRAVLALIVYLLAAQLSNRRIALLSWFISLIWLTYFGFYGYPAFIALLLAMLSLKVLISSFNQPQWRWVAGAITGMAMLFRHDLGAYAAFSQIMVLLAFAFFKHTDTRKTILGRLGDTKGAIFPLIAGVLMVNAPVIMYFLITVPHADLAQQLLVFPLTIFPQVRSLPYPPLNFDNFHFYFPFLVYFIVIALLPSFFRRAADESNSNQAWGLVLIALFGLLAFNQARVRADSIHVAPFFLPAVALLPVLWVRGKLILGKHRFLLYSILSVTFITLAFNPIYSRTWPSGPAPTHGVKRAQGIMLSPEQLLVIQFLQTVTKPHDKIFSGVLRHDSIYANDVMLYFLAERDCPGRYHELHPGQATTLPVQQEIADRLESGDVKYLVLCNMFKEEPNLSSQSSEVHYLDQFIHNRYIVVGEIKHYQILERIEN